jgi:hypothetical protein
LQNRHFSVRNRHFSVYNGHFPVPTCIVRRESKSAAPACRKQRSGFTEGSGRSTSTVVLGNCGHLPHELGAHGDRPEHLHPSL